MTAVIGVVLRDRKQRDTETDKLMNKLNRAMRGRAETQQELTWSVRAAGSAGTCREKTEGGKKKKKKDKELSISSLRAAGINA